MDKEEATLRGFKSSSDFASYRVGLKRELRKKGVSFKNDISTIKLEELGGN